jgi:hypothetical protein
VKKGCREQPFSGLYEPIFRCGTGESAVRTHMLFALRRDNHSPGLQQSVTIGSWSARGAKCAAKQTVSRPLRA